MSAIYLMRHGESVVNIERRLTCRKPDGDLTARGRKQAERAAHWLADKGIMRIYASPFDRAQQTAQIVGQSLSLVPVTEDGLREMDCGKLEGRTDNEGWNVWAAVYTRWLRAEWDAAYPGGETYGHAYERFAHALRRIPSDETALVVTHGGIVRTVVPYLSVNAAALQRVGDIDNTGFVILEPYDPGRYACMAWNLVEHL